MARAWKLFIISLLLSPHLRGQEPATCPQSVVYKAIDLRSEFGPIRAQEQMSWCFAYAGADLLSHWLYKKGELTSLKEEDLVSAAAVALNNIRSQRMEDVNNVTWVKKYAGSLPGKLASIESDLLEVTSYIRNLQPQLRTAWDEKLFRLQDDLRQWTRRRADLVAKVRLLKREIDHLKERFPVEHDAAFDTGGFPVGAARRLAIKGFCREGDVKSNYHNLFEGVQRDLVFSNARLNKAKLLTRITNDRNPDDAVVIQMLFPGLTVGEIRTELSSKEEDNNIIFKLADKACQYKPIKNIPDYKDFWLDDYFAEAREERNQLFNRADNILEQGKAVVYTTDGDIFDTAGKPFTYETGHAVLLVGKRYNCEHRETEYIVRNSWGPNACEKWLPAFRRFKPEIEKATKEIIVAENNCRQKCRFVDDEELEPVRSCEEACTQKANREIIAVNQPPYSCEDGYYIVRRSHLMTGVKSISYFE